MTSVEIVNKNLGGDSVDKVLASHKAGPELIHSKNKQKALAWSLCLKHSTEGPEIGTGLLSSLPEQVSGYWETLSQNKRPCGDGFEH